MQRIAKLAFDDQASFYDLFTTTKVVVNADLARLYGLDATGLTAFVRATGYKTVACSEGTVTFGPGKFYLASTSTAGTVRFGFAGSSNLTFLAPTDSATGSSGGAMPASIAISADSVSAFWVGFGFK